jgi:hypothetical protein
VKIAGTGPEGRRAERMGSSEFATANKVFLVNK